MKKQIKPNIKAHLLRGAFYLLLLLAVCAIPIALAQRNSARRRLAKPVSAASPAADNSAKNDFASELAKKQAALLPKPIQPVAPLGFNCDDPSITKHDDGTIENGGSGNPALVTEVRFADKFTPTSYPNSYS